MVLFWTVRKTQARRIRGQDPAAMPLPESVQVNGEPGALKATVTVPDAFVVVVGVKVTLKVVLCPAVKVNGVAIPLRVKPAGEGRSVDGDTGTTNW